MGRYGADKPPPDSPRAAEIEADAADPRNRTRVEIWALGLLVVLGGFVARNDMLRDVAARCIHALKTMMGF